MAPVELGDLPAAVPPRVRRLIQRCLERDPRKRLRDIGEARVLLEEVVSGAPEPQAQGTAVAPPPARAGWVLPAAVAGTAIVAALATLGIARTLGTAPADRPLRRFEMSASGPFRSSNQSRLVEISPDGKAIAWSEGGRLLIRPLDRVEPIVVATSSEPSILFWAPDASRLGYVAGGKIWTVPTEGGTSTTIADIRKPMTGGSSAAWCPGDKIVLGTGEGGLFRVSARGGDLEAFIPLAEGETDLHDASCLPDGSVLFAPHLENGRPSKLVLWADGKRHELLSVPADQDIWFPVYSPDGFVLFQRQPANAGVWAVPFSLDGRKLTGEPFMVFPEADVPSVSNDGTLVAVRGGGSRLTRLVWKDRNGKTLGPIGPEQEQWPFPELSPDGRRVAIDAKENDLGDVWIHDTERGTRTRLGVSNVGYSIQAWSPDGKTILYNEGSAPPLQMKVRNADGSGEVRTVGNGWAAAYSADGRYLLSTDFATDSFWDLAVTDLRGDGKQVPYLKAPEQQMWPRLSPDGRFVAYTSDEGGGFEVYLKPFPGGEGKWQVSVGGGMWPRWSPRGDRLYYANGDTLMEVDVASGAEPKLGAPREIFTRRPLGWSLIFGWFPGFDVSDDGQRFVVAEPVDMKVERGGILVIENWAREFARSKP
jgi:dipeptidyl aminopeptidase/acylaminoacyl peptidase